MPIDVSWYNIEDAILLYSIQGQWIPNDILDALDEANILRKDVIEPVIHIVDMTHSERIPLGLLAIYKDVTNRLSADNEHTIMVHTNQWIKILVNSFIRLARPLNFYFVENLDEAIELLQDLQEKV